MIHEDILKVMDGHYVIDMRAAEEEEKEFLFKELNTKQKTAIRKDWRACPISRWNSTTARAYLTDCAKAKFKCEYVCNNIRQENALISQFIKQYGRVALKDFIYASMKSYKGNKQYPYPTFNFMYSYMRERELPQIIWKIQQAEERAKELEAQKNVKFESMADMF